MTTGFSKSEIWFGGIAETPTLPARLLPRVRLKLDLGRVVDHRRPPEDAKLLVLEVVSEILA